MKFFSAIQKIGSSPISFELYINPAFVVAILPSSKEIGYSDVLTVTGVVYTVEGLPKAVVRELGL